ncbi:MAG: peptidoglycan-binding protein [Proteobacteria bacterium]|nr:peptidoglycan-binding protein [Pseudomonadota bacterium]
MAKEMLSIYQCAPGTKSVKGGPFKVMINPSNYSHGHTIEYSKEKANDSIASELKFSQVKPETVKFNVIFDGTGVVKSDKPVKTLIKDLREKVYEYEGSEHQTPHVKLVWGSFTFYGRLTTMSIDYTMFTPGGDPLRAKVDMNFEGYMDRSEESKTKDQQSPDLTHILEFKAGDTLPLACHRIYKDSSYYHEIAVYNNITNFRDIKPGTRLVFPPIG